MKCISNWGTSEKGGQFFMLSNVLGNLGRLNLEFYLVISLLESAQLFSSRPENNLGIQEETSKSQLKRFWPWTCSPLKWHCCQNKNRGVENENNWTIELFSSLTLPIPNEEITCWTETRGNESHGGRTDETLFWYVICENTVGCSLLPYPLLKSNSFLTV